MIPTISTSLGFSDVRKFKETKKQFDKVREDMEISLVKNAQAPRHKPHEVEEATGTLTITRKCFRHLALDYVLQVGGCYHITVGLRILGAAFWHNPAYFCEGLSA